MRQMFNILTLYGEAVVNEAGIAVLGYPGMWITENKEARKIREYLENG